MGKIFSFVSRHWLTVLIIVAVLLAFTGIKKIFSKGGMIGKIFDTQGNDKLMKRAETLSKAAKPDIIQCSKSEAQLKQIAGTQFQAMHRPFAGLGTDEELLFKSLNGLNPEDLKAVYHFFGVQEATAFAVVYFKGDLFGWYEEELSGTELDKMVKIWSVTKLWR